MVKVKVLNFGCNLCGGYGYVALEITDKYGGCRRCVVLISEGLQKPLHCSCYYSCGLQFKIMHPALYL